MAVTITKQRKQCTLHAVAVEVCCPHCGGAQINPRDGSMMWEKEDLREKAQAGARMDCCECDGPIFIFDQQRAGFTQ